MQVRSRFVRSARVAAATLAAVLVSSGCSLLENGLDPGEQASATVQGFLDAWGGGDVAAAAAATDDPDGAQDLLTAVTDRLGVTEARAVAGPAPTCDDGAPCEVPAAVTLTLRSLGDWTYESVVTARPAGDGSDDDWVVVWDPSAVHPGLTEGAELARVRELPPRASVLDRQGRPLTAELPVVTVGVEPQRLTDADAVYAGLEDLGVDPGRLAERVAAAPPDQFVEAVTVRAEVWAAEAGDLGDQDGVVVREATRSLAPTASFARAVLGSVGPATEETLAAAGPLASPADQVGTSGLQAAFQQQLAGRPGGEVRLVRDGEVVEVLHRFEAVPGEALPTTLDLDVQSAAEAALAGAGKQTALVALDVTTGGVLAAANGPDAGLDRALTGQYPPGSTFKVVSASALLRAGLGQDEPVDCPATTAVGGKRFKNYEFTQVPGADFRDAFAASCNTAFVQLTDLLDDTALPQEAAAFGLGEEWGLGVPSFSGSVPAPGDVVDEAAAMIGQSRVLASPLAMASVAATVASGAPRPPQLVTGAGTMDQPAGPTGEPLPAEQAEQLRSLMRAVVTEGTASALASYGEVHAKTGTAEYGTDDPPRTHAWLIGYRGDVAFAVLVEDGASGSAEAAPVVARFLEALG